MFFTLIVTLYTSRIVLQKLGVVDYGINNVVGGMVSMFSFLNASLANGTQRFITFALGKENLKEEQSTFSTTFFIHLFIAFIIGVLILLGGLYFLNGKLVIPQVRMDAAYWVFYCCVIICILNVTQVPYMASIIAHEDMSIYAYMSIFDAVAKLGIAFALMLATSIDRLKLYAVLLAFVQLIDILCYRYYCIYKYKECHIKPVFNKKLMSQILEFSGWNVFGSSSILFNNQGFNILLNMFFGPVMNAARGISNQVNSVASQFSSNFQTAVNPSIVKCLASGQTERMNNLIYNNARYAGLLILYLIIPLTIELPFALHIWLGNYPNDTVFFTRIILIQALSMSMGKSVGMGIQATGRMKVANVLAGGEILFFLPISFVLLKLHIALHVILVVSIIPWIIETIIEVMLMKRYTGLSPLRFYKFSYVSVFSIGLFMIVPLLIINYLMNEGWLRFFITVFVSVCWGGILIYRFGINMHIRTMIKNKVFKIIHR
jgi:O-antigen/teichoic acid export membrane protein